VEGRKIALIYIDAGGGHRAAATALCEVIREQQRPWQVEMLSIQDLLNSIDFVRKCTGIPFQDVYNIMLRRGWTVGTAQTIPLMHWLIRLSHGSQVRVLERHWAQYRPDLVVSLIPHYNRALKTALGRTSGSSARSSTSSAGRTARPGRRGSWESQIIASCALPA
jgi:1,2-diacylglycerol 3-beta-galactosyltransferase